MDQKDNSGDQIQEKIKGHVITIGEDSSIIEAAGLLQQHNIGVLVVTKDEKIIGILSERDIVRRVITQNLSPEKTTVKDVMTKEVVTVDINEGVRKIFEKLRDSHFRHVPIVDQGKLVGIVSNRDFLYLVEPR